MNCILENNKLYSLNEEKIEEFKIPENIYIKNYDNENYLVINSFMDKCMVLNKDYIDNNRIPSSIKKYFTTPDIFNIENENILKETLYNQDEINRSQSIVTIILAITYACNLRCTYCYQQCNPVLNKGIISDINLEKIFSVIKEYQSRHPDKIIELGLFGGEPLLKSNELIIDKIFDFCKENIIKIHIITNGTNLDYFMKKIIINRKIIRSIATTIDSSVANEETRSYIMKNEKQKNNSASYILSCLKLLLDYEVPISISSNMDKNNLNNLIDLHGLLKEIGFIDNKNFNWYIGRVDDRMYETNYPHIITDTDILLELNKINHFEDNCHAAFIKTVKNLCDKINMGFNQQETKGKYNYCWTSSPHRNVLYIDNDLDLFRCTYTVGRKEFSIGQLNSIELVDNNFQNRTYLNYQKCKVCKIGGYCSGGCQLSYKVDEEKQCKYELKAFDYFVDKLLIRKMKKLKVVNDYHE